jgi:hypothetical protein
VALPARGVFHLQSADADHAIAVYNPLVIAHFARPPRAEELASLRALATQARMEQVAGGMLFVVARKDATGGIEPRVREFFERMTQENSKKAGATAVVILTQGFGGSLMRSFITSLLLLTNKRKMLQIFASVDAACRWLAPQHDFDAATLIEVYEKATAHIAR